MPNQQTVTRYGFRDVHEKMDAHVKRENKRSEPRRTQSGRNARGQFDASGHADITKGARVGRGQVVQHPYGGTPYGTIKRPQRAKAQWKQVIAEKHDLIGQRVAREISAARPGCALLTVRATEATALAYKIRAAVKGGGLRDRLTADAGNPLYRTRITRVLDTLEYAIASGSTITLGVFTRAELKTIGAQRINAKHITKHVRNLEAKLAGTR